MINAKNFECEIYFIILFFFWTRTFSPETFYGFYDSRRASYFLYNYLRFNPKRYRAEGLSY